MHRQRIKINLEKIPKGTKSGDNWRATIRLNPAY